MSENFVHRQINLFTNFTESERSELAGKLADMNIKISELEAEKKAISSRIGEQIKEVEAEASALSKKVKDNGEERLVKCMIKYNNPSEGRKTITRLDNNETWIEDMTDPDYEIFREHPEAAENNGIYALPEHKEEQAEETDLIDVTDDEVFQEEVKELYGVDVKKLADNVDDFQFFIVTTEQDLSEIGFTDEDIELSFAGLRGALIVNVAANVVKAFNNGLPKNYIGELKGTDKAYTSFRKEIIVETVEDFEGME